ncbi:uncharacterized protein LOC116664161 [Camelus ferus]|uniref:Uncharacterized protein LOC116664161 n=1 Tax=Camelus ferus TaxID=419612 RepID=A0A8B8T5K1_CAMFR|nr:uncharacterized protein LOC116664161 [Camelus ferus]XP_032337437.1 uncharacterized protein LOC116664161 [Camelus ferus]XP_032337438.1 uncharacterized protein LOC116664161 [Camelus ferus]XP_032337439.1 uncharacterized protein LOC116664161 [Camelus ferus]
MLPNGKVRKIPFNFFFLTYLFFIHLISMFCLRRPHSGCSYPFSGLSGEVQPSQGPAGRAQTAPAPSDRPVAAGEYREQGAGAVHSPRSPAGSQPFQQRLLSLFRPRGRPGAAGPLPQELTDARLLMCRPARGPACSTSGPLSGLPPCGVDGSVLTGQREVCVTLLQVDGGRLSERLAAVLGSVTTGSRGSQEAAWIRFVKVPGAEQPG